MTWLLWKEYRENMPICVAGAGALLLPYTIVLVAIGLGALGLISPPASPDRAILGASLYSIWLSQLTLLVLGGNLIAGERADRSAEFLAYLPLSRGRSVAAKLLLALLAAGTFWGLNGPILMLYGGPVDRIGELGEMLGVVAVVGFTFFCVSWLVSALQSSPTFAVFAGLVFPVLVLMGVTATNEYLLDGRLTDKTVLRLFIAGCLAPAVTSFAVGTWYYLRRVEP